MRFLIKHEVQLENAKHGFSFLVKYGYAGDGRWNYVLDRKGNVLEGTISIFSDFHVLQGVAEYLKIEEVRTPENMELLKTCYETMEKNVFDDFPMINPGDLFSRILPFFFYCFI